MMWIASILAALVSGLAVQVAASPLSHSVPAKRAVPVSHSLHERHLPAWEKQWVKKSKVAGEQILPMRIGLKQSNLEAGHDRLMEM